MKKYLQETWHFFTIIILFGWLIGYLFVELKQSRDNERALSHKLYEIGKNGKN